MPRSRLLLLLTAAELDPEDEEDSRPADTQGGVAGGVISGPPPRPGCESLSDGGDRVQGPPGEGGGAELLLLRLLAALSPPPPPMVLLLLLWREEVGRW